MTYLLGTEIADRERLANQSRTLSLGTWAASILLIGFALVPGIRNNPLMRAVLIFSSCAMTAVSRSTAGNLATHDRILQDFRDISDNQRQQLIYEALAPKQLLKEATPATVEAEALPALPVHNISRTISQKLKSTVLLGAPRAGKGYSLAKALQMLPSNVDLWLIDPKDDDEESYYWNRVPVNQRTRFDVTKLDPDEVSEKVWELFNRFLAAPSSADAPKLLVVDECAPGLACGMSSSKKGGKDQTYKTFMGRLATICSVGPSKGAFTWIMSQSSTVKALELDNANKASFRLCAVGRMGHTESSWFDSLSKSMGIPKPGDGLSGYIQMLSGTWGYSEPFTVHQEDSVVPSPDPQTTTTPTDKHRAASASTDDFWNNDRLAVHDWLWDRNEASKGPATIRQMCRASFAQGKIKAAAMRQIISDLQEAGYVTGSEDNGYTSA